MELPAGKAIFFEELMRRKTVRFMILAKLLGLLAGCGSLSDGGGRFVGYVKSPHERSAYVVQRGDTVYRISKKFGVPIRNIINDNQLSPPYRLQIGDQIRITRFVGAANHTVRKGDTLYSISRQNHVSVSALARLNNVKAPYRIRIGQILRLPKNRQVASNQYSKLRGTPKTSKTRRSKKVPELRAPPRTSSRFLWPVRGKIISRFGKKKGGLYNDGLNIAAAAGSPVRAAENGVVAYGGSELAGFGNLILIKHSGGYVTAYAHNSVLLVKRGQTVRRGQIIAKVGSTGAVARPQLHFEIRKGRRSVNPLRHLVRRTAARY